MQKTRLSLMVLLMSLWCLPVLVLAQDDANLLTNPGFEQPYNEVEGVLQPLLIADGWVAWHSLSDIEEPVYGAASIESPDRILSGSDAQKYAAFASLHQGGVYQSVSGIEPDTPLTFSVNVYVWSSADGTNLDESIDPAGVTIEVGIDPTGGTDAESDAVVWSEPVELYDEYALYSVDAVAVEETVTVFVRTSQAELRLLTEVYLDDASLVVNAGGGIQPEATSDLGILAPETPTEEAAVETEEAAVETEEVVITEEPVITEEALPVTEEPVITEEQLPPTVEVTATTEFIMPTQDVAVMQTQDAELLGTNAALHATAQADLAVQTEIAATATQQTLYSMFTATAVIAQATVYQMTLEAPTITPTPLVIEPTATPFVVTATPTEAEADTPSETDAAPTDEPAATDDVQAEAPTDAALEVTAAATPFSEEFPSHILHTVRYGETVAFLAMFYDSSNQAIIEANGLNDNALIYVGQGLVIPVRVPPVENTPTPEAVATETPQNVYVVQRGDMLSRIAQRFNTTVTTLAQLNGIVNVNSIRVGQTLILPTVDDDQAAATEAVPTPEPITYVVQRGDSLYLIAIKYGVTIQRLADANQLANPNRLFVGQVLVIPQ